MKKKEFTQETNEKVRDNPLYLHYLCPKNSHTAPPQSYGRAIHYATKEDYLVGLSSLVQSSKQIPNTKRYSYRMPYQSPPPTAVYAPADASPDS